MQKLKTAHERQEEKRQLKLEQIEEQVKEGKGTFIDWETAKERIGKRIS